MKERPILFSAPMVRAIDDGRKTQTRRMVKTTIPNWITKYAGRDEDIHTLTGSHPIGEWFVRCPLGTVGDRLWVKETWRDFPNINNPAGRFPKKPSHCFYRADRDGAGGPWRPSIFMPRWASRITLEVTGVRLERLQDISEADALAEGIIKRMSATDAYEERHFGCSTMSWEYLFDEAGQAYESAVSAYRALWEKLNGAGSWADNPWVWVYEFKRIGGAE